MRRILITGVLVLAPVSHVFAAEEIYDLPAPLPRVPNASGPIGEQYMGPVVERYTGDVADYPFAHAEAACQMPETRAYRINVGYCPQKLVCLIPKVVGPGGDTCECGPYGIPPIYAAGQNVMVRQTPKVHERITHFLMEMGALVIPKSIR